MKRKIAVYANGWSNEIAYAATEGIMQCAQERGVDVFEFISHATWGSGPEINAGEDHIFDLGVIEDFDGLIVLSNILNSPESYVRYLCRRAAEAGVPTVSVGIPVEGVCNMITDNEAGMRELVTHLMEKHGVKRMVFAGGNEMHPDCQERLKVLKKVAQEHNCPMDSEDIYFGDWSFLWAQNLAEELCKSSRGLPDAIICANDDTALAIIGKLQKKGYAVPRDVIVTGFDCIQAGQDFYPALTTVKQDYHQTGYRACQWVYDTVDGKNPPQTVVIPSQFVMGESCCSDIAKYDTNRRRIGQDAYTNTMRTILLEQCEGAIEGQILRAKDVADLRGSLAWHYTCNHTFEGDSIYMVVENDYFNSVKQKRLQIKTINYEEEMTVIVAQRGGESLPILTVDHHELIPGYRKEEKNHLYLFMPLHLNQYAYGYIVFVDNMRFVLERKAAAYAGRIQLSLDRFRSNLYVDLINRELMEISQTDSLTGLGNRFSYNQRAIPMFENNKASGIGTVVMFVDINFMKHINDRFGHLQGDLALRIVADIIRQSIPSDWLAIRYGGDEFLIVGDEKSDISPAGVQETICIAADGARDKMGLPYDVSISCGFVVADTSDEKGLSDYIKDADERMYRMKQEIHRLHEENKR